MRIIWTACFFFWRAAAIAAPQPVPAGESPGALLLETSDFLKSPDPTLRDGVAYGVAADWILEKKVVESPELRQLLSLWSANLKTGVGATGDDRVFLRSFSALDLSLLAARIE